ncbi:MAG: hypothetical protein J0H32_01630 [Rhizobiales bacterium]|nr:hypothetical protein [Hyphomicrobiales bacterium]MBN8983177.1 hypothetical protein [Hyphomicrobiales bacterium]
MPAIAVLIVLAFALAVPISTGLSILLFGTPDYFGFVLIAAILLAMALGGWLAHRSRTSLRRR